jgi:hypothetical protein
VATIGDFILATDNGPEYARVLSLGYEHDDGSMGIIAESDDLAARAATASKTVPMSVD